MPIGHLSQVDGGLDRLDLTKEEPPAFTLGRTPVLEEARSDRSSASRMSPSTK